MTNSDENEDFKDFVNGFFGEYFISGRDKKQLISFLKAYPNAAEILVAEIIEHLENPKKRYLSKQTNIGKELDHGAIYEVFTHGPNFFPSFKPDGSLENNDEWTQKSYAEKVYQITKLFPKYKRSYIERIISSQNKQ